MKNTLFALFTAACLILAAGAAPVDSSFRQDADFTQNADSVVFSIQETITRAHTEPFTVALEDFDEPFQVEFLRAERNYLIPAVWDDPRYTFLTDSRARVFLACTEAGIWRLYPEDGAAERLSAVTFQGRNIAEIREQATGQETASLRWIDEPVISPDGAYAAYRSNRADPQSGGDAVWVLDTRTGEELPLTPQSDCRRMPHVFLSSTDLLTETAGDAEESRFTLVNVLTGRSVPIELPFGENRAVVDSHENRAIAGGGNRVIASGAEGRAVVMECSETLCLTNLSQSAPYLTKYRGYFPNGARFSPSGRLLAAPIAARADTAADAVLLIDAAAVQTAAGSVEDAATVGDGAAVGGTTASAGIAAARRLDARIALEEAEAISGFLWIGEDSMLVTTYTDSPRVRSIENPQDMPESVVWLYRFA